jgi:isoleucyl-tRNA synthetase
MREKKSTGLRKPIMSLTIISNDEELMTGMKRFEDYIIKEVNVSEVKYDMDCDKYKFFKVIPNHRVLGKRLGAVYRGKPKDKKEKGKKKKKKKGKKQPSPFI